MLNSLSHFFHTPIYNLSLLSVYLIRLSSYSSSVGLHLFSGLSVLLHCLYYFDTFVTGASAFIHHTFVQLSFHHVNVLVVYHSLPEGRCL